MTRLDARLTLLVGWNAAFWLACVALGYPRPYYDDGVIIGPALGLLEHGRLTNIYLSREFYPQDLYLFYPASFFWALAAWIAALGKSVLSLCLFWAACAFATSVPIGLLLNRLIGSTSGLVIAPVLLFGCIAYTGFRYELLGLPMFFWGIVLVVDRATLPGYFLLLATPTAAPAFIGLCAVAVAALFVLRPVGSSAAREAEAIAFGFAGALAVLAAGVSGNISGLISTMRAYSGMRQAIGGREYGLGSPVFTVLLCLLNAAIGRVLLRRSWREPAQLLPLLLIAAMLLSVITHLKPTVGTAFDIAALGLLAISSAELCVWLLAARFSRSATSKRASSAIALFALAAGLLALNTGYSSAVVIDRLAPTLAQQARRYAAQLRPGQTLVADARVIEALGYPTGGHVEDALVRHRWPAVRQNMREIPATELWVIGRPSLLDDLGAARPRPARNWLERLLIADGLTRSEPDRVCVIDAATSRRERLASAEAFVDAVCR